MKEILKSVFFVLWSQEGCFIHAENFHRNKLKLSSCLLFGYVSAHCKNAVWCLANRGSWMWNGVPELPLKCLPSFRCRGKNREKENEQKTEWENFPVVRIDFAALWSFLKLLFSFTLALFSAGVSAGMVEQNTKHKTQRRELRSVNIMRQYIKYTDVQRKFKLLSSSWTFMSYCLWM